MSFTEKLSEPLKQSPFYCRPLCYFILMFLTALFTFLLNKLIFAVFVIFVVIYCGVVSVKNGVFSAFNIITAIFLILGILCGVIAEHDYRSLENLSGNTVNAVAVIDEVVYQEAYASLYICSLESIDGNPCDGEITLEFPYETDFSPFDTLEFEGTLSDSRKGKSYSEKMNLISRNRIFDVEGIEIFSYNENAKSGFMYSIYRLQTAINGEFSAHLPAGASAYAKALFLGDTDGLSIKFKNDMSALGVSHILAVSGMHTSILATIVMLLCERLRISRILRAIMTALLAILFMFIADLSPSVTRSVIMLIISLLPAFFGRRGDNITSLFGSAFLICLISPRMVMSCSLLLSCVCCLAIVVCIPALDKTSYTELRSARNGKMKRMFKYLRRFISAVGISAVCSLVTAPLAWLYFGETSFVSVPANLVAVPVSTISMILTIPLLFFADVPLLGRALAEIFTFLYNITRAFADMMTSVGDTTVSLRYPFFVPILILLVTMFLFIRLCGIRKRIAFIAPFLLCTVVFSACLQIYNVAVSDRAEAIYMTSKTSEGFLLASGSESMYIDLGIGGKALPCEGIELSEERYAEVSLDAFMLTHYHSGHISTIKNLLLWNRIDRFYLPEPENEKDSSVLENLKRVISETEIVMYERGETVEFGKIAVTPGEYSLLERSTHPVLMLEIDLGEKQILWLGSSVTESVVALDAESALTKSEAVILGKHGPTMKESIKFYSSPPKNIPIIASPYAFEWRYGLDVTQTLEADADGFAFFAMK